ncbi:hypothetical protein G7B40_013580 [Aetokthonos hydrillicola Thurmond2011]|jgi:hypothetical protein|uniref:Polyketide synthase n=1 Tax=Aetokthonos hydrillicola Thurmond2011 TaxID=2712845 RepID=A0AAP5I697_9CYAN|nr:hypothetical protein [Aetokthonos hydrillicola]MBO3461241.1 class I SAM-dependent methyltransferase [Aetokthonos hydrillicola CCALA 1050]MBW4583713.1 hypothetical protein [Aetokthonos hydrillicola CCALA 1050]MDR9895591.1 hypothetical protein [Aetokthonos hydrillicola Thurmond2011]WJI96264.1 AesE [Aetokthonos hydrillicola Thurmond2011]
MELPKAECKKVMEKIFRHLDGIAVAPTIQVLTKKGIINFIQAEKQFTVEDILYKFGGNPGYLKVGIRLLENQGWLESQQFQGNIEYVLSEKGFIALELAEFYEELAKYIPAIIRIVSSIIYKINRISKEDISSFKSLVEKSKNQWNLPFDIEPEIHNQIIHHLDGMLVGPIIVSLAMRNIFDRFFSQSYVLNLKELEQDCEYWDNIFEPLILQNWVIRQSEYLKLTSRGIFAASKAYAYGVTVSYLPLFAQLENLLFDNPNILDQRMTNGEESHVDRQINIWASSHSHKTYFEKVYKILVEIFNRPIAEQPLGIAEIGCGDGSFLKGAYEIIKEKTERGKVLTEHPLIMVGADYNKVSYETAKKTLTEVNIPHCVLFGDINEPEILANQLWSEHHIRLQDLLNIRAFVDHNRKYISPTSSVQDCQINSTGTFSNRGKVIPNHQLVQNLIEHLGRWCPYVELFGLLVLELHIIPPKLAANSIGKTLATPYDATQGYTDQYPVELPVFLAAAEAAGLVANSCYQTKYPPNDLATISINYFTSASKIKP